ncbi:MAG: M14 family metallopeptidase [Phycisphaerae bacterium]
MTFCSVTAGCAIAQNGPPDSRVQSPREVPYDRPFFEEASYDPAVSTPQAILNHTVGQRPAASAAVRSCFERWATQSPRLILAEHGRSHEDRPLYHAVITDPRNHARLDDIRAGAAMLADPRGVDPAELDRLTKELPGIIWLGFGIHGDEISSTDAAVALAFHLIAARDDDVGRLLDELVILIDPNMNPDGRERFLKQIEQSAGRVANFDIQSIQHGGHWPWGRGNHYLFDMNRDWLAAVQPETRGRRRAILSWHPQVLVDSHEMGPLETYAFYPAREPFNPYLSASVQKWWPVFAGDQGGAFDRFGWSYYTREWMDMWYPGYTDGWSILHGAIGLLYEQAGVDGSGARQRAGTVLTYREAVHHHVVSAMATIETHRANRQAIAADFVAEKRTAAEGRRPDAGRVLLIQTDRHPMRARMLLDNLHEQGADIEIAEAEFTAAGVTDRFRNRAEERTFATGTALVRMRQPSAALIGAAADFDPRMTADFLREERRELERRRPSRMFDVSAWSLPLAYDVSAFWADDCPTVASRSYESRTGVTGQLVNADASYGFVLDGHDDAVLPVVTGLLRRGVKIRFAEKPFQAAGRDFDRGGFLIRRGDNGTDLIGALEELARSHAVTIQGVDSGRSSGAGPDLGAERFRLLERPRVAVVARGPIAANSYGHVWHELDVWLGLDMSGLDAHRLGRADLRRYNVLIIPDGNAAALTALIKASATPLRDWVRGGGTLIAMGGSAAALTDPELKLSGARLRRNVLDKLDDYRLALKLEQTDTAATLDPADLYEDAGDDDATSTAPATQANGDPEDSKPDAADAPDDKSKERLKQQDAWARRFAPQGVLLRGLVDTEAWITAGCGDELPVFVAGDRAFLTMPPVATPIRLAARERLRLSGLLWPEAAERLADSAYLAVERTGRGQIILFSTEPTYRGIFRASARLLVNAVLLGPGVGAEPPPPW